MLVADQGPAAERLRLLPGRPGLVSPGRPTSLEKLAIVDPRQKPFLSSQRLPNRNRVFVVDDDASMLRSVARLLRQLGYAPCRLPRRKPSQKTTTSTTRLASFSTSTSAMFQASNWDIVSKRQTFPCRSST